MEKTIKGYKVFNPDLTCRGFQFKVGEIFEMDLPIKICGRGFHFCLKPADCFEYYKFDSANIVCEVEALGEVNSKTDDSDSKVCTNKIKILRQLTWNEVLEICNEGKGNTGLSNTGDRNTGDRNTGYRNTGNSNTGYSNTGDWNTGDWNTGNRNTGNWNTGNRNTGDWNTGDWNTGNRNTGYSNTGDRNTGVFCTIKDPKIFMFNKQSDWTISDFENSGAYSLMLNSVDTKLWITESQMTDGEKEQFPSYKTCEGYLRDIPFKEAFQNAWHNWSESNRNEFINLPNFDEIIFEEITGVKI